jgi:glycosyltransferase involved in cell wall biosynthesis
MHAIIQKTDSLEKPVVGQGPQVAVITRTKDRPLTLRRALKSVVDQAFDSLNWVIVNDGGAREPVDEIAAEARSHDVVTHVIHLAGSGRWAAANLAISESDGTYVVLLDDDDTWHPEFLQATVGYLESYPHLGGVATQTRIVNETIADNSIRTLDSSIFNPGLTSVYLIDMTRRNLFTTNSFVFRRAAMAEVGDYDDGLPVLADWEFHLRFVEQFDVGVIPRPLANWHLRAGSGGDLGNTVLAGVDQHVLYDTIIRNRLLRRDLKEGRVGVGVLASLGRRQTEVMNVLTQVEGVLGKMNRAVRKSGVRRLLNWMAR